MSACLKTRQQLTIAPITEQRRYPAEHPQFPAISSNVMRLTALGHKRKPVCRFNPFEEYSSNWIHHQPALFFWVPETADLWLHPSILCDRHPPQKPKTPVIWRKVGKFRAWNEWMPRLNCMIYVVTLALLMQASWIFSPNSNSALGALFAIVSGQNCFRILHGSLVTGQLVTYPLV